MNNVFCVDVDTVGGVAVRGALAGYVPKHITVDAHSKTIHIAIPFLHFQEKERIKPILKHTLFCVTDKRKVFLNFNIPNVNRIFLIFLFDSLISYLCILNGSDMFGH